MCSRVTGGRGTEEELPLHRLEAFTLNVCTVQAWRAGGRCLPHTPEDTWGLDTRGLDTRGLGGGAAAGSAPAGRGAGGAGSHAGACTRAAQTLGQRGSGAGPTPALPLAREGGLLRVWLRPREAQSPPSSKRCEDETARAALPGLPATGLAGPPPGPHSKQITTLPPPHPVHPEGVQPRAGPEAWAPFSFVYTHPLLTHQTEEAKRRMGKS